MVRGNLGKPSVATRPHSQPELSYDKLGFGFRTDRVKLKFYAIYLAFAFEQNRSILFFLNLHKQSDIRNRVYHYWYIQ